MRPPVGRSWIGYAVAIAGVALVSAAIGAIMPVTRIANASMLYLVVVLAVATLGFWLGTGAGVLTALGAAAAVLLVGCPHAVGRAAGTALVVGTSRMYGGPRPGPQELLAADPDASFFTDEVRCPIQVGDLADALIELAATDLNGVLHVAGADRLSRHEFAELLAGRAVRAASTADAGVVRPRDCSLAIDRARELLRTRLRGAREVLEP